MVDFSERVASDCSTAFYSNAVGPKDRQAAKIRELQGLLRAEGIRSVSCQAAALGLSRSTTWALLKGDHKHSGVSANVLKRMLATSDLPASVRLWIDEYVSEKLAGAYGHNPARLRQFRRQLVLGGRRAHQSAIGSAA